MKTIDENKNEKVSKPKKSYRWIIHVIYGVIIIAILLLWKCCCGEKEKECQEKMSSIISLTLENDSLKLRINELENQLKNQKAVLNITDTVKNHSSGKFIEAIIVSSDDSRESSRFIKDVVKIVKVEVPVSVECPPVPECPDVNKSLVDSLSKMNKSLDDSIDVCLDKQYRTDSARILMQKRLSLRSFTSMTPPSLDYSHTYIEYLPNPYRRKAENSLLGGICFATASIGFYGVSEALGHPVYFDDRDNSAAQRKHNQILALRILSGVSAAASVVEFGRTISFHHMEGKFIVNPTKIGLTINLDSRK